MCHRCFKPNYFTKYAWIKPPLKENKAKTVVKSFVEIINAVKCKANKLRVDQGKEFYIYSFIENFNLMQKWLDGKIF